MAKSEVVKEPWECVPLRNLEKQRAAEAVLFDAIDKAILENSVTLPG